MKHYLQIRNKILVLIICLVAAIQTNANVPIYTFCNEPLPYNQYVYTKIQKAIDRNIKAGATSNAVRNRMAKYLPYITSVLKSYGIPTDFKYLPLVESKLINQKSSAGAGGVWQFMPLTAREMGMTVTATIDQRNDLIIATHSACRYLLKLYKMMKSWTLTASAYNCGPGCILSAIKRSSTRNYYYLRLNKETSEYVYNIIAYKIIYEGVQYDNAPAQNTVISYDTNNDIIIPLVDSAENKSSFNSVNTTKTGINISDISNIRTDSIEMNAIVLSSEPFSENGNCYIKYYSTSNTPTTIKAYIKRKTDTECEIVANGIDLSSKEKNSYIWGRVGLNKDRYNRYVLTPNLRIKIYYISLV